MNIAFWGNKTDMKRKVGALQRSLSGSLQSAATIQ
jgi:hypothetical protein